MRNDKGITLVALIVTIIILIILTGVGIYSAINQLENARLKSFYTKLEIAVEGIEVYKNEVNDLNTLNQQGTDPTAEQISLITSLGKDSNNFRYFTAEQVDSVLGISGVDLNLLVDFEHSVVINPEGIEIDGVKYYTLENAKYTVQLDNTKISGPIDFNYTVEKYGNNKYKINVVPVNIGNIKEGIVKYKKDGVDYWTVAKDNVIIVQNLVSYDIMYTDANGNTITKTISLSLDAGNNVIATE